MSDCLICQRQATRDHPPNGRGPDGEYLDPDLVMELCHSHHELCHDDWHTFGLANPSGRTVVELLELGMRRIALGLSRVDIASDDNTFWGRMAAFLVVWASRLRQFVAALDAIFPTWRSHPVFYIR